jgi:hypothetical protein
VRERTGQKGKALLHPIRLALTGEPEGLELDLAVPAIERAALWDRPDDRRLGEGGEVPTGIRAIPSAAERAREFLQALG